MRNESISILSVNFEVKTKKEQLDKVKKRLDSGLTTKIFTPNPQIILKAVKDKKTLNLLKLSDINLSDGIGIALASSLLGKKLPERISGIDFAQELLFLAAKHKYSVFLLGGKSGRAHKARRALCQRIPNLNVCGCHNGYFNKVGTDNERIKKIIQSSRPDFLFVCLGSPCQEKWIAENISSFPSVKLAIGLGGSIDVWSGKIKRARILSESLLTRRQAHYQRSVHMDFMRSMQRKTERFLCPRATRLLANIAHILTYAPPLV